MNKSLKSISCFLMVLFVFNTVMSSSVLASQEDVTLISGKQLEFDSLELVLNHDSEQEVLPASVGGAVAVFIGGILVGYVIDGAIIYVTGASGGEWVSRALSFVKANRSCKNVYFSKRTSKPICHSGSGGSF